MSKFVDIINGRNRFLRVLGIILVNRDYRIVKIKDIMEKLKKVKRISY